VPEAEAKPRPAPPPDDTVRIGRERWPAAYAGELREQVVTLLEDGPKTLAEVRDHLGTSRKGAQGLLEWMDAEGLTIRRGEARVLRRRRREAP
jgi:selenocysteine-specific elongation factor